MVSSESKTSSQSRGTDCPEGGEDARAGRRKGRDGKGKRARKIRPLDETTLRDLALSYVARFSTTGAKLEAYLARKLRERGVAEDTDGRIVELDVPALVARLVELGYVDDELYARSKSRDLKQRGYGARRVEEALWAAGVDEEVRSDNAPSEAESRRAVQLLAKKRRFGPYGEARFEGLDREQTRKLREKQVAAMLRAGHSFEHVRFIMDAAGKDDIDAWLEEAEDEEKDNRGPW